MGKQNVAAIMHRAAQSEEFFLRATSTCRACNGEGFVIDARWLEHDNARDRLVGGEREAFDSDAWWFSTHGLAIGDQPPLEHKCEACTEGVVARECTLIEAMAKLGVWAGLEAVNKFGEEVADAVEWKRQGRDRLLARIDQQAAKQGELLLAWWALRMHVDELLRSFDAEDAGEIDRARGLIALAAQRYDDLFLPHPHTVATAIDDDGEEDRL